MNINDCIHEYERLYTEGFGNGSAPMRFFSPRKASRDLFEERLRDKLKDIVHRRLPRKYGPKIRKLGASEAFAFDEDRCRT